MKVFFDYQVFYLQKYGGISKYFVELAGALNTQQLVSPQIIAPFHHNEHLRMLRSMGLKYRVPLKFLLSLYSDANKIWLTEYFTKKRLKRGGLLHETYYSHRIEGKFPRVVTIHDMIYELFHHNKEGERDLIAKKKRAIYEADAIIAVSQNTRKDLLKFYPEVEDKITVVLHGVTNIDITSVNAYRHPRPFILFVGRREWYKNFNVLLEVYGSDKEVSGRFDIICCGGMDVTEEEKKTMEELGISDRVHFLNGNDDLLNSLYRGAAGLAYLSDYEGFGLPVLEAMRFGCPVLCSASSSLPEVAGKAAIMIDPRDKHAVLNGLKKMLFDETERKRLYSAGIGQANHFSWNKCARETSEVYKKISP